MEPIKVEIKKPSHVIGTIVAIVVIAIGVQWARFYNKVHKLGNEMGAVIPANYFPFNGTYIRDANGKIKRA